MNSHDAPSLSDRISDFDETQVLCDLLDKMIFPDEKRGANTRLLHPFIEYFRFGQSHGRAPVDWTPFDKISRAKEERLQAGALLYARYWLPKLFGSEFNNSMNIAAQMVVPPLSSRSISRADTLASFFKYRHVSHYWAAFLAVAKRHKDGTFNNRFGPWRDQLPINKKCDLLIEFIENVKLDEFLAVTEIFREFETGRVQHTNERSNKSLLTVDSVLLSRESVVDKVHIKLVTVPCRWNEAERQALKEKLLENREKQRRVNKERQAQRFKK